MGPADLFAQVVGHPLGAGAARFAAAGIAVFPCVPGGKRPLTEHGFHNASTDPARVAAWWRRWPEANIAVPTGSRSGLDVVDVDRRPSGDGFGAIGRARQAGLVAGWLALVRTPSGGMHAYYPTDPDRAQPSWQAARAHVDFRGEGGYIIVPPSTIVAGGRIASYEVIAGPRETARPVDAAALRDHVDPRPEPYHVRPTDVVPRDAERLAAWVSGRAEGERNRGLFWASCRLAEAGLGMPEVIEAMAPAAEYAGLSRREIATTIRSAFRTSLIVPLGGARSETASHRGAEPVGRVIS